MNWLDTQTKEILQKVLDPKLAPPKTTEFTLVLVQKGADHQRLVRAICRINECDEAKGSALALRRTPVTINPDLTEEDALWGQFELICCDTISIFIRSEVMEQNGRTYLWPLFEKTLHSAEFQPTTVIVEEVPETESGQKFVDQFLGDSFSNQGKAFPATVKVPFKKARIMQHWASRVGAKIQSPAT